MLCVVKLSYPHYYVNAIIKKLYVKARKIQNTKNPNMSDQEPVQPETSPQEEEQTPQETQQEPSQAQQNTNDTPESYEEKKEIAVALQTRHVFFDF